MVGLTKQIQSLPALGVFVRVMLSLSLLVVPDLQVASLASCLDVGQKQFKVRWRAMGRILTIVSLGDPILYPSTFC